jgi:hypothetical protein
MQKVLDKKTVDARKEHNADLIRRMRNGENLYSFDSAASWYPPRPVIAKDPEAVKSLYGKGVKVLQKRRPKLDQAG